MKAFALPASARIASFRTHPTLSPPSHQTCAPQNSANVSKLLLHTSEASTAKVEGYAMLMSALKANTSLTDLTLAKKPQVTLAVHTSRACVGERGGAHASAAAGVRGLGLGAGSQPPSSWGACNTSSGVRVVKAGRGVCGLGAASS